MSSNTMTVGFPGGKRVDASYGGFEIRTDQCVDSGGEGSAPEPYDYFLASLATCAGIYVLGFCQKRDIPYEGRRRLPRLGAGDRIPHRAARRYSARPRQRSLLPRQSYQ